MRTATLSSLRGHAPRLLASLVAIVIGVGFLAAVLIGTASARAAATDAFGAPYRNAGLVAISGQGFGPAQQTKVAHAPGVAAAALVQQGSLMARMPGADRPVEVTAIAVPAQHRLAWQQVQVGRLPQTGHEVAVPAGEGHPALGPGDMVRVRAADGRTVSLRVVGVLAAGGSGSSWALTPAAVATLTGADTAEQMIVALTPQVSIESATRAIRRAVPGPDVEVLTPAQAVDRAVQGITHGIDVLGAMLTAFGAIAAAVTGLVIANTYAIVLAARARQLALLRAVGATRTQVLWSTIAEAGVLGAVGGVLGVGVGFGLVHGVLAVSAVFDLGVPAVPVRPNLVSLLVPFVVGLLLTVVAALGPSRRAARVAPMAALQPDLAGLAGPSGSPRRLGVPRLGVGVLAAAAGGGLLAVGAQRGSVLVGMAGGLVSFAGVLLLGPVIVPALLAVLGLLPGRIGRVPGRLAAANAARNPRRAAATSAALLVGITLIVTMTVGVASTQATFDRSIDEARPVDLVLDDGGAAVPTRVAAQVAAVDGIAATTAVRTAEVRIRAAQLGLVAVGLDRTAATVVRGDVLSLVQPGQAVVSASMLQAAGLHDGQRVRLTGPQGATLTVVLHAGKGVGELALSASDLERLAPDAKATQLWLRAEDGANAGRVSAAVSDLAGPHASVSGGLAERSTYQAIFSTLLEIAVGLLAVSVLIALVGVGNTLSLSVLERLRENALLRALGLTRGQLRETLAIEAVLVCAVAAVIGILLGIGYGWAGTSALMAVTGYRVVFALPWGWLGITVAVALAAGLVASVLPARRAAAVAPAEGLASE